MSDRVPDLYPHAQIQVKARQLLHCRRFGRPYISLAHCFLRTYISPGSSPSEDYDRGLAEIEWYRDPRQLLTGSSKRVCTIMRLRDVQECRCDFASSNDARHMYARESTTSTSLSLQLLVGNFCRNIIRSCTSHHSLRLQHSAVPFQDHILQARTKQRINQAT